MIKLEEIQQAVKAVEERVSATKNKIPQLEEKVYALSKQWAAGVVDGESDENSKAIYDEIGMLERQIELLEKLDVNKEVLQSLHRDASLVKKLKDFEEQQRAKLEVMLKEEEELAKAITDGIETLIGITKDWQQKRRDMVLACSEMESVHPYIPNGDPIPNGGFYNEYRNRMTYFNLIALTNKIRIAAGLQAAED